MRIVLSSLAFALALATVPAMSVEPQQKEAQGEKAATGQGEAANEPKKICRRVAVQTGSRQRERLCMTSEQWREFNSGN